MQIIKIEFIGNPWQAKIARKAIREYLKKYLIMKKSEFTELEINLK